MSRWVSACSSDNYIDRLPPTLPHACCKLTANHAAPNNGGMKVPGIKGLRQPVTFRSNLSNATLAELVPAQIDIAILKPTIGIKTGYFPKPFATNVTRMCPTT